MKRIFNYILPLVALTMAISCSKELTGNDTAEGKGTLAMQITTDTRVQSDGYNPMDYLVVSIYNNTGGLLRRYRAEENIPASLELLAGDYRVEIEAGELMPASFTSRFYTGAEDFSVVAGQTTQLKVTCKLQNVLAEAKFDKTVADNFGTKFHAWIVAADTFVEQEAIDQTVPALKYTADALGYFTIPEGVTSLAWAFHGEHPDPKYGTIDKTDVLSDIKIPGKYVLTFKFSPDLPGYIEAIPIRVDTNPDEEDDTVVFTPDPILEGEGFDAEAVQRYTSGERVYRIFAMEPFASATMEIEDTTYNLLSNGSSLIGVQKINELELKVTLTQALLANRTSGDHPLKFHITDVNGGELNTETIYRYEGALPIIVDQWSRTATMRYVSFGDQVSFSLRTQGGEWLTLEGVKDKNDVFVGSFAPQWTQTTNKAGLKVSTLSAGNGLLPGLSYEHKSTIGSVDSAIESFTTTAAQTIPGGDMEDGSMNCFKVEESNPSPFWASGNNGFAKTLCSWSSFGSNPDNHTAKLQSEYATVVLAAGNLLSGYFYKQDLFTGAVEFGQPYTWTTQPKALRLKYAAKIGKVNQVKHPGAPIGNKDQDLGRIFACIVDWDKRHVVTSGTSAPTGVWDPMTTNKTDEGKVIGYASKFIDDTELSSEMIEIEIPFEYYDTTTKPSGNITVIVSCSANAYGDFMVGCDSNTMYVDDFEWVY